jgi:glycosyltransferase involved in cell wall biosynthesis
MSSVEPETTLFGNKGKRILCLANLRHQKNHFFLLEVAQKLKFSHPDWTFHLVGKNFEDDYSREICALIKSKNLEKTVFIYGSKNDSINIINQAEIAILTSKSEGLPVALIEYGLLKKPVVTTMVGEIPLIIQDGINGYIVGVNDVEMFYQKIVKLILSDAFRIGFGISLHQTIIENNSEEGVVAKYLQWITSL